MDIKQYCKLIVDMKLNGRKFSSYVGSKWFITKFIILIMSVFMVLHKLWQVNIGGYVLIGYLSGMMIATVRFFIVSNRMWEFQKEVIDWGKVEKISRGGEGVAEEAKID